MTYSAALAAVLRTVFGDEKETEHPQSGVRFRLVDGTWCWNARGSEFLADDDEGNRYCVLIEARGKEAMV